MAYDIDGIKQRNPIADVVEKHGIVLRESGAHLVGHCPFHEDEHPSFAVYPETRSFYCFGCNANGDPAELVETKN
jgi:DNA primase